MTCFSLISRALIALFLIAACAVPASAVTPKVVQSVVTTDLVRAELMAHAPQGVNPGQTVWVGLQLQHQPEWHTYWKNSGDSGQPTTLRWTLPSGITAGDIVWPLPKKIPIGDLANYGYDGTVLLSVPLTIGPGFKPSPLAPSLEIKLQAAWLVCRKECVPQEGTFGLQLPLESSTALHGVDFEAALQAAPKALNGRSHISLQGNTLQLTVTGLPATWQRKALEFYPETPEVIQTAARWSQSWQDTTWTASIPLSPDRLASPEAMPLVLATELHGKRTGLASTAVITGQWPAMTPPGLTPAPVAAAPVSASAPPVPPSFWVALLAALIGGLLLNLMPCVFPVLAIKVIGFTRHAQDHRSHRVSGLAYSAGVIMSFLALGALMLAFRNTSAQLGWGFQLQSPAVVAGLAALFTVLGLNLAGWFEFGQFVPARLASLETKNPAVNAFLSGMLAVVIASPCTAPFMGASLGLALGLPGGQAMLIFGAIGMGMALPYLAASWSGAVAAMLPRPGVWMDTFRRAMAFPMFATVVWLVWVLGQQSGIDGAASLLALLLALSWVIWSLTLHGRNGKLIAIFSIAVFALLTGAIGHHVLKLSEVPGTANPTERWQSWAPGKVQSLLDAGKPVFVDFTAAWCVTCQYNKKTTLANAELLADFDAKKVTLLRADWTRQDPAITAALSQLGRNGVPVYVLYQGGRAPVVLSEILSQSEVRAALGQIEIKP